jgi:mono/diheme cytochrome c family protein
MHYHCTSTRGWEYFLKDRFHRSTKLRRQFLPLWIFIAALGLLAGCDQRRRSDAELGLTPQEAAGRRLYDIYCDRCHAPYSSRGRQGPPMKGLFKRQYMPLSGMPTNDDRVGDIIRMGRNKMPAYSQVMNQQQIDDLLAYMHTL